MTEINFGTVSEVFRTQLKLHFSTRQLRIAHFVPRSKLGQPMNTTMHAVRCTTLLEVTFHTNSYCYNKHDSFGSNILCRFSNEYSRGAQHMAHGNMQPLESQDAACCILPKMC